jgi:FkbM family methyltransferase
MAMTPAARAWIRYIPISAGKNWLWQNFHWRPHDFTCWTRYGTRMSGNTRDLIQRHIYFFGTWEPNISSWLRSTLRPGDGFIDIGANIGHYSLLASRLVGENGKVLAVEPAQWIHSILDQHIRLNGAANVRTVQVAASDACGKLELYPGAPDNIGKTSTVSRKGEPVMVEALPLSQILREDEIRCARVIKIDVEGAELQVLRGLAPVLGRMRDDLEIVMEISPSLMPEADAAQAEIFATMAAHGFLASRFDNDYRVDSYLRGQHSKRPAPLGDMRIEHQADILFTRRQ